jgi:hypothetical protein
MPPTPTAKTTKATIEFTCPECGRTFTRAASLGAHRHQSHKIPGASNQASSTATKAITNKTTPTRPSKRRRANRAARTAAPATSRQGADRDALLQTLFPNGIPPKESVIRSVNAWLDEAERLTRLR